MAFVGLGGLVLGRRDVRKGGGMVCGRGRRVVVRMVDDLNLKRMPIPYPGDEEDILSLELQIQHVEEEEEQRMSMVTEDVGTTSEDVKRAMKGEKQMRDKDYTLRAGEIAVRFTNTPLRKDIIVPSLPGKNLLKLGDSVELKIPRACRTGLCGACTVDMEDPQFPDGVQTIRACQTSVLLPDGCDEMVIDLHRMDPEQQEFSQTLPHDPFERFNELDTKYRAAAPPSTRTSSIKTTCGTCEGLGKHICPECMGEAVMHADRNIVCSICMGRSYVRCADCQGTGTSH